jgi:hypothetical protein
MPVGHPDRPLTQLLQLCELKPLEIDDCICIGSYNNAVANREHFGTDLSGFEAFVNHVHLTDILNESTTGDSLLEVARRLAHVVMASWAASILPFLRGRTVFFYAGGMSMEDFFIRFHIDRGESDTWVNIHDAAFLSSSATAVWRFNHSGFTIVHEWSSLRKQ